MSLRPNLQVVTGDWLVGPEWLDFPATIRARAPHDKASHKRVRVHKADVLKAAAARRRQTAFQFWSVLQGKVPPISLAGPLPEDKGLISLYDAHACFEGVRRPLADDDIGGTMVAYILKPPAFITYELSLPCPQMRRVPMPEDLVFVAYVRLDEPSTGPTIGVLTHWQFVGADPLNSMLPIDHETRYDRRLW